PDGRLLAKLAFRDTPARGILLEDAVTGSSGEQLVVAVLESGESVLIRPDETEDVRRECSVRIETPRLVEDADPAQLHLLDLVCDHETHSTRDINEPRLP